MRQPSLDRIFRTHFAYVVWLARLFGLPEREAEDVAQEVFVSLFQAMAWGRYDDTRPVKGWLRTATYRTARDHRKLLSRQGQPEDRDFMDETVAADSERILALREQWALLLEVLAGMEENRRDVFVLHEIEELTTNEIADALAISPNTVSSRLRLARLDFDDALRRRRAQERRVTRGIGAILLPLGADSILRMTTSVPRSALVPPGTEERVWGRVQQEIGPVHESPRCSRSPGTSFLTPAKLAGVAYLGGVATGVAGFALLASLSPAPSVPVPVESFDRVGNTYAAAMPPPMSVRTADVPGDASAPVVAFMPRVQRVATPSTDADEKLCLQAARVPLDPPTPDPSAALRLLGRCDQHYPRSRFPDVRERIRRDALALQSATRKP